MKVERTAYVLNKGSRTEFPKGGLFAVGKATAHQHADGQNFSLRAGKMGIALQRAIDNFREEFGRDPDFDKVLFRGGFTSFECIVEICEAK